MCLADGEGNILVGPRAVLGFDSSSNNLIQGNYDLHDYRGGWSQGFNSDPRFAGQPEIPYRIPTGCVWSRTYRTAQVLAHYREMYRPGPGSPLVDAGDPADGTGVDIGAIGEGTADPADLFGRGIR